MASLGSTSLLSYENTEARYLPYGGYRVAPQKAPGCCAKPSAELTDVGYTGHMCLPQCKCRMQDKVGLIFMRARYYSAGLGRFVSADTIVQEPGNPQLFKRYGYERNRLLIFAVKVPGNLICFFIKQVQLLTQITRLVFSGCVWEKIYII